MALRKKNENSERIIDLDGPDGNAFVLLGIAAGWSRQIGLDEKMVSDWMKSGDYENLLAVFERFFGSLCVLTSRNQEMLDRVAKIDLSGGGDD
jgi:hypothetical protein